MSRHSWLHEDDEAIAALGATTWNRGVAYVPIVIVTAKTEDVDEIVGLELGADDYIARPFNTRALLSRVFTFLRLAYGYNPVALRPAGDSVIILDQSPGCEREPWGAG